MKGIVVGLGGWGSSWVRFLQDGGWEITAWVDANPDALDRSVAHLGADRHACFGSLDKAIERTEADAAFIFTTPNSGRAKDIIAAVDAGLHVLVDKPLTTTQDEMAAILEAHRSSKVKIMVGQNYRWFPGAQLMRRTVASGELGRLGYLNVHYHMAENMRGHHIVEMADGLVLGMCVHHLDTMRFVIGAEPDTIWATTWNPTWSWTKADACVQSVLAFPGPVKVTYFAGWAAHQRETDWFGRWRLEFENGALITDGGKSLIVKGDQRTEIGSSDANPGLMRKGVLKEFTTAIEEDRTPMCSVEDNAHTMRMAFGIIESSKA